MNRHWLRNVRGELAFLNHLEAFTTLRCIQPLAFRWWADYSRASMFKSIDGPGPRRYHKILAVLKHIESEASHGSVAPFLSAVERFAMHSEGAWLKVAGGQKADVLKWHFDCSMQFGRACRSANSKLAGYAAVECGAFIGYTSSRLAERLRFKGDFTTTNPFVSVEADPVHVLIARHFIDYVQLAKGVEIIPGMVRDVAASLVESFGCSAISFTFMDQKGTTFHSDFALFQATQGWHPGAEVVADNTLRPGAPVYVWQLARAEHTTLWSLPEFLEESMGVEDWMAVAQLLAPP